VTLGQLRSFATVARLGSVKAAAAALGVSEPAVSEAVKALRADLGDELFVRGGGGIVLTPGGQRLAGAAAEIVGLADQARRAVRESRGEAALLRVAATGTVSEHVAAPLVDAFRRRAPHVEVSVEVEPAESFGALLADRRADVTLGPRPGAEAACL
jgi:LysR family transcriptional regulator, low CO2-responsive transcriptional regulator